MVNRAIQFVLLAAIGLLLAGPVAVQALPAPEAIQARVEQLREIGALQIGAGQIAAVQLIPEFYQRRGYQPAWSDPRDVAALIKLVEHTPDHGLDPEDYHLNEIEGLRRTIAEAGTPQAQDAADLDLLLTDSVVRLAFHAKFGKVDPASLDSDWNFARSLNGKDPVATLQRVLDTHSIGEFFARAYAEPYFYTRLREALAAYRAIDAAGGWPSVPQGETLQLGDQGDSIRVLRERLQVTGDLSSGHRAGDPAMFDVDLAAGVEAFQRRHGLDADGKVGKKTLAALNVPVETRVAQIRVNMERVRWVYQDLPSDFLLADIAGFHVYLVKDGAAVWSARAQVGKPYRKTPVFRAAMTYLEFNPTWTVPPTILSKDILPKLRKDPGYLARKDMVVLEHSGKPVDSASIDWSSVSAKGFPYLLRQQPGPENALGRVKFMFPNPHAVYLHDTPSKSLFDRSERAFSSGCIRVERPFALAELVLNDSQRWSQEDIQQVLDSKQTQRVSLAKPLPVLLLYWTAEVGEDGRVYFREDIYGRDEAVLRALDAPPRFTPPSDIPEWYRKG